jgi:chromosome segregation protein
MKQFSNGTFGFTGGLRRTTWWNPRFRVRLAGFAVAVTALALLIAIFRYQPSPFCILDEVDAPLDEANVGRFTRLIADMSAQTQFIIVTHNRKTMETGSVLYGVTMQEPGVSKLVSVRWEGEETAPTRRQRADAATAA